MTSAGVLLFFCMVVIKFTNPAFANDEATTLPQGYTAYPTLGFAYKVFNISGTWFLAQERCLRDGGNLAVIDTGTKYNLLSNQLQSHGRRFFIGIFLGARPHKFLSRFIWTSVRTELEVSKNISWASEGPQSFRLSDGQCLCIETYAGGVMRFDCDQTAKFVCELPIPENYSQ